MSESVLATLLAWLALPTVGLPAVFVIALVSATLLPLGSEPAVFAYVSLAPEMFWPAIAVATVGNTCGGMFNFWIGYSAERYWRKKHKAPDENSRSMRWARRLGPRVLLLSWLPVVGDPLCLVAGWLRLDWKSCLIYMAIGKAARYTSMTAALLWIPASFWEQVPWLNHLMNQ